MTRMQADYLSLVKPREWIHFVKFAKPQHRLKKCPGIMMNIKKFNTTSYWVMTSLLEEKDVSKRRQLLKFFIQLALHLLKLQNFNGVMEVMCALNHSCIHRLKETWKSVHNDIHLLEDHVRLQTFIDSEKNFRNMRNMVRTLQPPCIPYLGLYLSDLTFIQEGNPDFYPPPNLAQSLASALVSSLKPSSPLGNAVLANASSSLSPALETDDKESDDDRSRCSSVSTTATTTTSATAALASGPSRIDSTGQANNNNSNNNNNNNSNNSSLIINFDKRVLLASVVKEITLTQTSLSMYNTIPVNQEIEKYLIFMFGVNDEAKLMDMSLELEPRESQPH
jgi:hypothetical protein